jgi:hypothetical protein
MRIVEAPGCGGDPGAETDVAESFERGFEQGVLAFADGADCVMGSVELLLDGGAGPVLGFLNATVMVACSPS